MKNNMLYTKKRLNEWGYWCYQIATMGLSYSSKSLLSQIASSGGDVINPTVKALVPVNEKAEAINDIVERLAANKPKGHGRSDLAKVLRLHYAMFDDDYRLKIQASGLAEHTYYRHLKKAHQWVADHLEH
jgi:hypothetical protein